MALTTGSNEQHRVAVHEAGHGLMCVVVGVRVRSVSRERIQGFLGRCFHDPPQHAGASAAIAAAGLAAELVRFGDYDSGHSARDLEALDRYAGGDEDLIVRVIESVRIRLSRRAENDVLTVLAGRILEEGFVSGHRVRAICETYGVEPVRVSHRIRPAPLAEEPKLFTFPRPNAPRRARGRQDLPYRAVEPGVAGIDARGRIVLLVRAGGRVPGAHNPRARRQFR